MASPWLVRTKRSFDQFPALWGSGLLCLFGFLELTVRKDYLEWKTGKPHPRYYGPKLQYYQPDTTKYGNL